MIQTIRNNVFETNSSSTHTLTILKHNDDLSEIGMEAHIPIMDDFVGYTKDPETILSYLYTISLIRHDWHLLDKIKQEFPLCIFQKPQWDLPYESETGFCDDREVISFCELINSSMVCHFDENDMSVIWKKLKDFVFRGELFIKWDGNYLGECVADLHNIDRNDSESIKIWVDNNLEVILETY